MKMQKPVKRDCQQPLTTHTEQRLTQPDENKKLGNKDANNNLANSQEPLDFKKVPTTNH